MRGRGTADAVGRRGGGDVGIGMRAFLKGCGLRAGPGANLRTDSFRTEAER